MGYLCDHQNEVGSKNTHVPLIHCHGVTAGKLLNLSLSQFLHLQTLFGNLLTEGTAILLYLTKTAYNAVTSFIWIGISLWFNWKSSTLQRECQSKQVTPEELKVAHLLHYSSPMPGTVLEVAWFSCSPTVSFHANDHVFIQFLLFLKYI